MLPATRASPSSAAAHISSGGRATILWSVNSIEWAGYLLVKSVLFDRLTKNVVLTIAVTPALVFVSTRTRYM